jgi:hypothetical protein
LAFREASGAMADFAADLTDESRVGFSFPHVRNGFVVEAFPNAFLGVCLGDDVFRRMPILNRGQKFDWLYYQWKQKRLIGRLSGLSLQEQISFDETFNRTAHHEHRAALVCLLTALLVSRANFTAVGEDQGGWFFLPPWECWATWAQDSLVAGIETLKKKGNEIAVCLPSTL